MYHKETIHYQKIFKIVLFLIAFTGVGGYAYYESRDLIHGANLSIEIPHNGETFTTPLISVTGSVGNIKNMSLNGRTILTDQDGHFSEMVALGEGYNRLSVTIVDRFNRTSTKELEVVYEPANSLTRLNQQ